MITHWDIISSIRSTDNAILYTLLIDGTEHDARLIAKKLQGYVRAPQPASAPYVYRFALPDDLDEDTLEKIRVAVREGIAQAKKVNEFIPGGSFANSLFNENTDKEDKDFPTFITLDPSESFFRSSSKPAAPLPPAPPTVDGMEQKQIDLNEPEEEIPQIAKTLEEIDEPGYRSDDDPKEPPITVSHDSVQKPKTLRKKNFVFFRKKEASPAQPAEEKTDNTPKQKQPADAEKTASIPPAPPAAAQPASEQAAAEQTNSSALPTVEEEPVSADVLTSIENKEEWSDEPPADAQTDENTPQTTEQDPSLQLEVQAVQAEKLPTELTPVTAEPEPAPAKEPENDLPLSDRDMLIKDMEGTMLGQSLDDILLAETKYDMFLDLDKLDPAKQKKDASKAAAQAAASKLQAANQNAAQKDTQEASFAFSPAEDKDTDSFNIFDQKIKDQTNFIDLEDIKSVTERITQKDLSFLQHANTAQQKTPAAAPQATPVKKQEDELDKTRAYMPLPSSFGRIAAANDDSQEVMDPFEQMMAASKAQEQTSDNVPAAQEPQADLQQAAAPADIPPSATEADADRQPQDAVEKQLQQTTPPQEEEPAAEALSDAPATEQTAPAAETLPDAPATVQTAPQEPLAAQEPAMQQTATADTTERQTQAAVPESLPQEEQENRVVPPSTPITEKKMPENNGDKKPILRIKRKLSPEPASAQPAKPVPPPVPAPSAMPPSPAAHTSAQPQEEKHGATILRRRRPAGTFLEKTRTIDHSIELPLSELKKHNWPLEVPLIPTYTLENMTISVNRFAHATAISVIDNPGKLYNPLVLHGASGTGKTHFLHAIGYALSNKYGQENIFITNGVRLSRGIQRYVMEGNIDKFESFADSVKALLIDDIHLIAINEQNRAYLSKLLNDFRKQQKQIVITSKYPPESLAKLEELLNFRLDSGWISDLKPATGNARMRIIQKMLTSNGIDITNEDINRFFGHPNMSLGTVSRAIRRVRVLEKLIFPHEAQEKRSATAIFDQLLATTGEDQHSLIMKKSPDEINSAPVSGNGEWGRIGFFYPQNHSNMMNWLVFALQQRAKELGINGGPELAVRSSYSTENIISSAFKIANLCDNKKLKGAVILGPETDTCEPSVRENFYDILTHMLEIMLIRCGVINYEDVNAPSTYVKILSELLR